jgi:hypothetical protein
MCGFAVIRFLQDGSSVNRGLALDTGLVILMKIKNSLTM